MGNLYKSLARGLLKGDSSYPHRVLTTMSDGEAHISHLAAQTLANMVIACRADYLHRSGLRPLIQHALMALPIESSKLFAGKVQEARLWDAEEDEADQRKAFLKVSPSGYHKQQTYAGKSSASATQAKQLKPKPPPQGPKDSGSFKRGGGSSRRGRATRGRS